MYLSLSYGSDKNLEKSDKILSTAPTLLSITLEKRIAKSELYGLGLNAHQFTSVFENYNHLSLRGYQHFGLAEGAKGSNFDPYIGAFMGLDNYQKKLKPAVGFFVGVRLMFTQAAGAHVEFSSMSSGFNSGAFLQFGITSCFMRSDVPKIKKWGSRCPK